MYEICSKLTIKSQNDVTDVLFILNFEQILHIVMVFPLLILNNYILAGILSSNILQNLQQNTWKHWNEENIGKTWYF